MRDDASVDAELWPLIEAFPPIDVSAETLGGFREAMAGLSVLPDPASHADVLVERVDAAGVRCVLLRPAASASSGALLHIHGGGYVMGSPEMDVARNIDLVRGLGCTILSVDYALAPEAPHPAGLEDCHKALVWLAGQAEALGFPANRIAVIGESAGGGMAGALALLARDRGSVPLVAQILIYPMLVPSESGAEPDACAGRYIWNRASDAYCWSALLPTGAVDEAPFPGQTSHLEGLPPSYVAVGALDLFVHDNLAFVSRLLRAGVPTELHLYPGAIHGFDRMVDAGVAKQFGADLLAFLRRHLG